MIQTGAVEVDGDVVRKASRPLEPEQLVRFPTPEFEDDVEAVSPPETFELRILFEDACLLVIDKQPGLIAHRPERCRVIPPNVADLAVAHCGSGLPRIGGDERPGIVHRLDKETSGVMVIPKTDEAFHFVRSQFKARTTQKEYRAISFGEPRFDSDYIDRSIAPHPRFGDRMTVVKEGGKEALTYYEVVERFRGFTDFRCKPRTGRTHQLRAHCRALGAPIVGDGKYGGRAAFLGSEGIADMLHLHARAIELPRAGGPALRIVAPLPDHMAATWRLLGFDPDADPFGDGS